VEHHPFEERHGHAGHGIAPVAHLPPVQLAAALVVLATQLAAALVAEVDALSFAISVSPSSASTVVQKGCAVCRS
jgi:hypothetical protein